MKRNAGRLHGCHRPQRYTRPEAGAESPAPRSPEASLNAKFFRNGIVMLVLVIGTVALLYTWLIQTPNTTPIGYSAFLSDVGGNTVSSVVQEDQTLIVKTTDNRTYTVVVPTVLTDVYR